MTNIFNPNNRDIGCFLVTKHSWKGKYKRIFSVGTFAITTYNPQSLEITNQWNYGEFFGANPESKASGSGARDEFVIHVKKKSGKSDSTRFSSDYTPELLSLLFEFESKFCGTHPERHRFNCFKEGWADQRSPVILQICATTVLQLNAQATVIGSYKMNEIKQIIKAADVPGGFILEVGDQRRRHLFASQSADQIVREIRQNATDNLNIIIPVSKDPLTLDDFRLTRLGLCSKDDSITSYVEFKVQKFTPRHDGSVSRLLCLSEKCIVERDIAAYSVVCARPLTSIVCLSRNLKDPQKFGIEYENGDLREYSSNERDLILASLIDGSRGSSNYQIFVQSNKLDKFLRILPFKHLLDEDGEFQLMQHIINVPLGLKRSESIRRFNANIPFNGLIYSQPSEGFFAENKGRVIVQCLESVLAETYANNEPDAVNKIESQLACLHRLFASKAGFQAFTAVPGVREKLGTLVINVLKWKHEAIDHATVEMLCSLMQPMHANYELRLEQLNKKSLLSSKEFVEHLLDLIVNHVDRGTGSLVISAMLDFLTYIVCAPYCETTSGDVFDMILECVAARGRAFYRLFHNTSMTVVKGASVDPSKAMPMLSTTSSMLKLTQLFIVSTLGDCLPKPEVVADEPAVVVIHDVFKIEGPALPSLLYFVNRDSERFHVNWLYRLHDEVTVIEIISSMWKLLFRQMDCAECRNLTINRCSLQTTDFPTFRQFRKLKNFAVQSSTFTPSTTIVSLLNATAHARRISVDSVMAGSIESALIEVVFPALDNLHLRASVPVGAQIIFNFMRSKAVRFVLSLDYSTAEVNRNAYLASLAPYFSDSPLTHRVLRLTFGREDEEQRFLRPFSVGEEPLVVAHKRSVPSDDDVGHRKRPKLNESHHSERHIDPPSRNNATRQQQDSNVAAGVVPIMVDLAVLADLHVNRAQIHSQTNVIEAGDNATSECLEWYYNDKAGVRQGPISFYDTKELYRQGTLTDKSEVWAEGLDKWTPLGIVPQFKWTVCLENVEKPNLDDSLTTSTVAPLMYTLTELSVVSLDILIQMCSFFPSRDEADAVIRLLPKVKGILSEPVLLYQIVPLLLTRAAISKSESVSSSILAPILPEATIFYLEAYGPERYAEVFLGEFENPEIIWNTAMRQNMIAKLALHVSDFSCRLTSNIKALYRYCPIPPIEYEQLEEELFCHYYYYLRHLCDEVRFPNWPIREPEAFLRLCFGVWQQEMEKKPASMSIEDACRTLGLPTDDTWKNEATVRKAIRIILIAASNKECVNDIAVSLAPGPLLVLLVKLKTSAGSIFRTLIALASNGGVVKSLLDSGGLLYILHLMCDSTVQLEVRNLAAELLAKLQSDKLTGPRWTRFICYYLPPIFSETFRDNATSGVTMFDAKTENPELIWNDSIRTKVKGHLKSGVDALVAAHLTDPAAKWDAPTDRQGNNLVYQSLIEGELIVGGIYVRIFNANPSWTVRHPKQFSTELIEMVLKLMQSSNQAKQLEEVTTALCSLFQNHPATADQIPAQGYLPQFVNAMIASKNVEASKTALLILDQPASNDFCADSLATQPIIVVSMKQQPSLVGQGAHALKFLLKRCPAELAEQLLKTNAIPYLLQLLGSGMPGVPNPGAAKAEIVDALKSAARDLTHGEKINEILNKSPIWAEYRDQRHDLFLPASGRTQAITGPASSNVAGYLTNDMFSPHPAPTAPPSNRN